MQFSNPRMHQIPIFPRLSSRPAGEAYSDPPDLIVGGEGARCPLPKNLSHALCPLGLALSIPSFYSLVPLMVIGLAFT